MIKKVDTWCIAALKIYLYVYKWLLLSRANTVFAVLFELFENILKSIKALDWKHFRIQF